MSGVDPRESSRKQSYPNFRVHPATAYSALGQVHGRRARPDEHRSFQGVDSLSRCFPSIELLGSFGLSAFHRSTLHRCIVRACNAHAHIPTKLVTQHTLTSTFCTLVGGLSLSYLQSTSSHIPGGTDAPLQVLSVLLPRVVNALASKHAGAKKKVRRSGRPQSIPRGPLARHF
eukprot:9503458-Pyramimonas_sp.AAC.1